MTYRLEGLFDLSSSLALIVISLKARDDLSLIRWSLSKLVE